MTRTYAHTCTYAHIYSLFFGVTFVTLLHGWNYYGFL